MVDVITRLKVDSSEYDSKIKRAAQGLLALEKSLHDTGRSFADADKETIDFAKSLGRMDTVSQTAKGKIGELGKAFVDLSMQYNRLTDEEKASPFGKALSQSLDQLKQRTIDAKAELKSVESELDSTGKSSNDLSGIVNSLAGKFGLSTEVLTTFGATIGTTTVALKVAKDAFMMNESNIDEWGRTVEGAKGAYESFLASLNSDSWGNFFTNLEKAINGARDLYDAMDRLNSVKGNNAAAIAYWRNEVQRLRVQKQNGGDVDLLLKAAEGNLKSLQSQGIQAGKAAGRQMINQTLTTAYNQQTGAGAGLSESKQKEIADNMLMNGQKYFDEQRSIRDKLAKKADASYSTIFGEQHYVNIKKLSEAEREQYLVANAVTEAETRLQKGINQYAQALGEEASANREEFKTNRYVLQGRGASGGGGGRSGGATGTSWAPIEMGTFPSVNLFSRSITDIEKDISRWQKAYKDAGDIAESMAAKEKVERYQKELATRQAMENPFADAYKHDFTRDMARISRDLPKTEKKTSSSKEIENFNKNLSQMTGGISSIASGVEQMGIELPEEISKMLAVMQGISTILTGILAINTLMNSKQDVQIFTSLIPGMAHGGIVPHAANGYFVPGTHYSGDVTPIMANAGELVLSRSQQSTLAAQLQHAEQGGGYGGTPYVDGEKIYLGMNNFLRRSGKGEIVTSRR